MSLVVGFVLGVIASAAALVALGGLLIYVALVAGDLQAADRVADTEGT